jgi:hypothetical protein
MVDACMVGAGNWSGFDCVVAGAGTAVFAGLLAAWDPLSHNVSGRFHDDAHDHHSRLVARHGDLGDGTAPLSPPLISAAASPLVSPLSSPLLLRRRSARLKSTLLEVPTSTKDVPTSTKDVKVD